MIDLASTRRPGGGFCARMVPAGATGSGLVPLTMRPKWSGTTSGPASARLLPIRFGTHGWAPSHARRSTAASARDTAAIAAAATAIHTPLLRPACPHPIRSEEHTSELQSPMYTVSSPLLDKQNEYTITRKISLL